MPQLNHLSKNKIFLWSCIFLILLFITYLFKVGFSTVSVLNSTLDFDKTVAEQSHPDPGLEEYRLWQKQFEVNPEKFNNFVKENPEKNLN